MILHTQTPVVDETDGLLSRTVYGQLSVFLLPYACRY